CGGGARRTAAGAGGHRGHDGAVSVGDGAAARQLHLVGGHRPAGAAGDQRVSRTVSLVRGRHPARDEPRGRLHSPCRRVCGAVADPSSAYPYVTKSDSVSKKSTKESPVTTLLVEDIGLLVHGDSAIAPLRNTTIVIEDGVISAIGTSHAAPDVVLSAG